MTIKSGLDENSVPAQDVPSPKKPPKTNAYENTSDSDGLNLESGSGAQLVSLMKVHPFMALFVFVARNRYPTKRTDKGRVEQLKTDHDRFYLWCVRCDFALTVVFAILLVAVVTVTAWKTLIGPFPWEIDWIR